MPSLSQFTIYTSFDRYGPGPTNGSTGSLLPILDACLVNGYGTGSFYKPAAGWTKPLPNSGSVYGAYTQGSGSSGYTLFINDNGSSGTSAEVDATGWNLLTSLMATTSNVSNVGGGYGQFPIASQALSYGRVNWRKSGATGTLARNWMIAADANTMYIWLASGDNTGRYFFGAFGDIYSFYGNSDIGRCMIIGRNSDNNANISGVDFTDCIANSPGYTIGNNLQQPLPGHYMASNTSGFAGSVGFTKKGDTSVCSAYNTVTLQANIMTGNISSPDAVSSTFSLCPIWIVDPGSASLRGLMRGIYQLCNNNSNFSDGQTFNGSGDYTGKSFMVVKSGPQGGIWCLEISNTINTN